jgi:E3 ubiquitin-protein ligase UBR2
MSITSGSGYCDCGDIEAFPKFHLCKNHEELSKKEISADKVLESFPHDVQNRSRELIKIILKYILNMTSTRKKQSQYQEWKVGEKEKETWPDLRYTFQHSNYCILLINDDSHSYKEVIRVVKNVLKCPEKKATDITEYIDREGRAIIKVGTYKVNKLIITRRMLRYAFS